MFPQISAIVGLLFFASTLPNGIRLIELPAEGDSVEITAGYTSGGLTGLASNRSASPLLLYAYAVGATTDLITEPDRTALRITAPKWALPLIAEHLPGLFTETPVEADDRTGRSRSIAADSDFRAKVEEEIRNALLGPTFPQLDYSTDDAFVAISAMAPDSLREALAGIPKRASAKKPEEEIQRLPAERTLRFRSDLPVGAVVFASPIQGVYYRQWYLMLLLDRLIQRVMPFTVKTSFPLNVRPYYYRLELPVPAGQLPEPAEEKLLQELERLQYSRSNERDLAAARQDALDYLDSQRVREWFASNDIVDRREEGKQWVQSMSADDLRVAARDLLIMNRVIATWPPKPVQTSVTAEPLSPTGPTSGGRSQNPPSVSGGANAQLEGTLITFPPHEHSAVWTPLAERLSSGVSVLASTNNAVFVSGGPLTRFEHEFTAEDLRAFQQYRADRILVLTPASSMDRARQLWSGFKGSAGTEKAAPKGMVSAADLPPLFVLKTILDLKLIESGWWSDTSVRIDASEGSTLWIRGTDEKRAQILGWIKAIATTPLPDAYFRWAREVAIHRFASDRADIQALTWERDTQHIIQDVQTISAQQVQDVAARIPVS